VDASVAIDGFVQDGSDPPDATPDAEPDRCPRPTAGPIAPGDTVSGTLSGASTTSLHTYQYPDVTFGEGAEAIYELDLDHRADIVWEEIDPGHTTEDAPYPYIRQDCDASATGRPLYDLHPSTILSQVDFHGSDTVRIATWFDAPPGHYYLILDARQAVDTHFEARVTLRDIIGANGSCPAATTRCDEHEGLGCDAASHTCVHRCDLRFDSSSVDLRMPHRCDDRNAVDGDGCDHRCEFEGVTQHRESIEPNDTPAQAQAVPPRVEIHGQHGPSDDVFAVTAVPGDVISAEILGTDTRGCAGTYALARQEAVLELHGPDGGSALLSATIARQDWLGLGYTFGRCPLVAWPVQQAGTYYIVERSTESPFSATMRAYDDYRLRIRVEHPSYVTVDPDPFVALESSSYLPHGTGAQTSIRVDVPGALVVAFREGGPGACTSAQVIIEGEEMISPRPPASATSCWLERFVIRTFAGVLVDGPAYIAVLPR
jgi:cysteine-rich repeat protein